MFFKNSIGKQLKEQASKLGACERGLEGLESLNQQELVNRFIHFIDFFVGQKEFPTNKFIKDNFDKEVLHKNNIYVDERVERRNARSVVVVQGNSKGFLLYDSFTTSDIYVRHDSEITIDCSRMSKVFINIYDNAKVKITQRDTASVYVYKHGDKCEVNAIGEVLQRQSV